jgi:hypothetical protein
MIERPVATAHLLRPELLDEIDMVILDGRRLGTIHLWRHDRTRAGDERVTSV